MPDQTQQQQQQQVTAEERESCFQMAKAKLENYNFQLHDNGLVTCITCGKILNAAFWEHGSRKHGQAVMAHEERLFIAEWISPILASSRYRSVTERLLQPVPFLPIFEGFACTFCTFYSREVTYMSRHCHEKHAYRNAFTACSVQALSGDAGARKVYFGVFVRNDTNRPGEETETEAEEMFALDADADADADAKADAKADADADADAKADAKADADADADAKAMADVKDVADAVSSSTSDPENVTDSSSRNGDAITFEPVVATYNVTAFDSDSYSWPSDLDKYDYESVFGSKASDHL
jgi:hypothetical protein